MTNFAILTGRNELWPTPEPDRNALLAVVGGAVNTNNRKAATAMVATAVNSPTFFAFAIGNDTDYVHIGQSPTFFPNDITRASVCDDQAIFAARSC